MITKNNFSKQQGVFTTHNAGIMKAAERLRKANSANPTGAEQAVLDEAAFVGSAMAAAVLPPPPPAKMDVKSVTESGDKAKPKVVKHGKAKAK